MIPKKKKMKKIKSRELIQEELFGDADEYYSEMAVGPSAMKSTGDIKTSIEFKKIIKDFEETIDAKIKQTNDIEKTINGIVVIPWFDKKIKTFTDSNNITANAIKTLILEELNKLYRAQGWKGFTTRTSFNDHEAFHWELTKPKR